MYEVTAMRLCDEKDSLHGRVFFLREKCGKNRESDKSEF